MSHRVLVKKDIDDLVAAGETQLICRTNDILTTLAKEYAQDHGIQIVRCDQTTPDNDSANEEFDKQLIKQAVIAVLGETPEGLDAAIAKVLRSKA